MASSITFICQECGSHHPKWGGRCSDCGGWNSLQEEIISRIPKSPRKESAVKPLEFSNLMGTDPIPDRYISQVKEFDRVCGGGLVPGSVILVGGDPGIGKSTLLLQIAAALSEKYNCKYISGEEGLDQIRLRAQRLEIKNSTLELSSHSDLNRILASFDKKSPTQMVVIDSIQTMYLDQVDSAPGTVNQVRLCSQELIRLAKKSNLVVILVGHVTKEGNIAGPRVLEHMVDTVLYFEGDRGHQFRILRSVKNRFGATDEIGVFEMTQLGLKEVLNPSAAFISDRQENVSGVTVFCGIEGSRPLLLEIQSLVATSPLATPRRTVIGWDSGRLSMIIAVIEARCGLSFYGKDVYLNVAGGLKITEPAADLAVAAALISSLKQISLPYDCVIFGEIGLSGEIRPVGQSPLRLKEAEKLGFKNAWTPQDRKQDSKQGQKKESKIQVQSFKNLRDVLSFIV